MSYASKENASFDEVLRRPFLTAKTRRNKQDKEKRGFTQGAYLSYASKENASFDEVLRRLYAF